MDETVTPAECAVNIEDHYLSDVKCVVSPNQHPRPAGNTADLLVIHGISLPPGVYGGAGIEQLFTNCLDPNEHPYYQDIASLKVSAHLVIYRSGEITQFVPFNCCAWHAGQSIYQGRQQCNDFSIGIELEGSDMEPYETIQYQQLVRVTKSLLVAYPTLSAERIVGHRQISPERKTDPGPFFEMNFLERYS